MHRGYDRPLFEMAPTNGREADVQAHLFGFQSVEEFAQSFPDDAMAADIGSGVAPLLREVARQREDVQCVCLDLRYDDDSILARAKGDDPPSNVRFVQGDILARDGKFPLPLGEFDLVLTSRLVTHIELEDRDLAVLALHNMAQLLNPTGSITALRHSHRLLRDRLLCRTPSVSITRSELEENPDELLLNAIKAIRTPGIHRWWEKVQNIHFSGLLGQCQWRLPDAKGRVRPMRGEIWDPEAKQYVRRMSQRGHQIYLEFLRRVIADPLPRRIDSGGGGNPIDELKDTDAYGAAS
jgi:hypothetical protein